MMWDKIKMKELDETSFQVGTNEQLLLGLGFAYRCWRERRIERHVVDLDFLQLSSDCSLVIEVPEFCSRQNVTYVNVYLYQEIHNT